MSTENRRGFLKTLLTGGPEARAIPWIVYVEWVKCFHLGLHESEQIPPEVLKRLIKSAKARALRELRAIHGVGVRYKFIDLPDLGGGPRGYVKEDAGRKT